MGRDDTRQEEAERFDVRSADGTTIAVWVVGGGPPLVMVHGALSDHRTYAPLVDELRGQLTTFAVDRRGRGASGDGDGDYAIEAEFHDVAAVVDAVAERTAQPVALWGNSYGADCALGGAALTDVHRLVLYEPGLGITYPDEELARVQAALTTGGPDEAASLLFLDLVGMTEEELHFLRSSPQWPARLAAVPPAARELRAESEWSYEPGQFDAITAPTLVLAGSESPPEQDDATRRAAAAIPGAEIRVLEGHGHMAHQTDPALVARTIVDFVSA